MCDRTLQLHSRVQLYVGVVLGAKMRKDKIQKLKNDIYSELHSRVQLYVGVELSAETREEIRSLAKEVCVKYLGAKHAAGITAKIWFPDGEGIVRVCLYNHNGTIC